MSLEPMTNFLPPDAIRFVRENPDNSCVLFPLYSPDGKEMMMMFVAKADVDDLPTDDDKLSVIADVYELDDPEAGKAYVFATTWTGEDPDDQLVLENIFPQSNVDLLHFLKWVLLQDSWRYYFTDNWAMNLYSLRTVKNRIAPAERNALIAEIDRLIAKASQEPSR